MGPGDGVAHRPLAAGGRARPPVSSGSRSLQPRQQRRRREHAATRAAASSIASGSPSRRRQIAATAGALAVGQREVGPDRLRPLRRRARTASVSRQVATAARRPRGGQRQRRHRELAARRRGAAATRLVTSDRQSRGSRQQVGHAAAPPSTTCSKLSSTSSSARRRRTAPEPLDERLVAGSRGPRAPGRWSGATRAGSRIGASATKPTPSANVVASVGRDLQGEPGLADAAGAGQGEERNVVAQQQLAHRRQLPLPADQRRARQRQSRQAAGRQASRSWQLWPSSVCAIGMIASHRFGSRARHARRGSEEAEADQGAGQVEQALEQVRPPLVADARGGGSRAARRACAPPPSGAAPAAREESIPRRAMRGVMPRARRARRRSEES